MDVTMDVGSDHEQENPKRLKTLACSAGFPLLHQFVLENSGPNGSVDESCLIAVLRSMSDVPGCAVNELNCDGYTALHLSVLKGNSLMVKGLLSCLRNIDVNATCGEDIRDNWGSTALHLAAQSGNLGIVQELCNKGATIDVKNIEGHTALFIAAECGHLDAMKLLVSRGADVNVECDDDPATPLAAAASLRCNLEAVKYLVGCGAVVNTRYGCSPLFSAARLGDVAVVEFLISNGAEVESDDDRPLHAAVASGSVEAVTCLLRSGADVNAKDGEEVTPLHLAASRGTSEMTTLLLDRGANPNAGDKYGQTPLHLAAKTFGSALGSVYALLDRGAEVNAVDMYHATPLYWALDKRDDFIYDFIEYASRLIMPKAAKIEMAKLMIEEGADLRAIDEEGRTPLHDTVYGNNDEWNVRYDEGYRHRSKIIRVLLEKGADVRRQLEHQKYREYLHLIR